ncbi:unnamed protein product, partial [Polarella glacialis]
LVVVVVVAVVVVAGLMASASVGVARPFPSLGIGLSDSSRSLAQSLRPVRRVQLHVPLIRRRCTGSGPLTAGAAVTLGAAALGHRRSGRYGSCAATRAGSKEVELSSAARVPTLEDLSEEELLELELFDDGDIDFGEEEEEEWRQYDEEVRQFRELMDDSLATGSSFSSSLLNGSSSGPEHSAASEPSSPSTQGARAEAVQSLDELLQSTSAME